jgi:hypothetical protein
VYIYIGYISSPRYFTGDYELYTRFWVISVRRALPLPLIKYV